MLAIVLLGCLPSSCKKNASTKAVGHALRIKEAKGYAVPQDSLLPPKIIPREAPIIVPAIKKTIVDKPANEYPIDSVRTTYTIKPRVFTPGENGISLPKIVPAKGITITAGLPKVVTAQEVMAVDPNPNNFSSFNRIEGLGSSVIQFCYEDKNGNLWIATGGDGVTKYDGHNLTTYTQDHGLCNDGIEEVLEAHEGNLWFASWGGGLSKFDGESFTNFTFNKGLGSNYISGIVLDKNNHLWATTLYGGVFKYDGKSFTHYDEKSGMEVGYVDCVMEDSSGNLWFGTNQAGLVKFDGKSFHHFNLGEVFPFNWVSDLREDDKGNLWIATKGAGLIKYNGSSFTNYTEKDGLPNNSIHNIETDANGNLWMSPYQSGITQFDGKAFKNYGVLDGLENNSVESVLEDSNGNLWFGDSGGGLSKLSPNSFHHVMELGETPVTNITTVSEDKEGNLWLGSYGNGVLRYDGESFIQITGKDLGNANLVNAILEDSRGDFWFGTQMAGLLKYDGNTITQFPEMKDKTRDRVLYIFEDSKGNLWLGTEFGGVVKFEDYNNSQNKGRFIQYGVREGLSHNTITGIQEDKYGNMWFATHGGGATRYDGTHFTHFAADSGLGSDQIQSLAKDSNGNLWFGTLGKGVSKYNGQYFTNFDMEQGLGGNRVKSILEDSRGDLWLSTDKGLSKMSNSSPQSEFGANRNAESLFSNFDYKDGFLGNGANGSNTLFEDKTGTIWVGLSDRLTSFNPLELKKDTVPPKLALTNVALFNETVDWSELFKKKDTSLILKNGVKLANLKFDGISPWHNVPQNPSLGYQNNTLTFNYVGTSIHAPHKIKYQYRLEGFEEQWNAPTSAHEALYGNLPWGDYNFKVKAMNGDGVWSETLDYSFTIRAPWWHTWWAYLCYAFIFGGSIIALYRFQLHQKLKKAERLRLKELDAFKTKFYTNITHEFRTPLTVILGMAQQVLESPATHLSSGLNMIMRNGQNLLSLVNQMLDLSKLESRKLQLCYQQSDVVPYIRYITESFHSLAEVKGIEIHFQSKAESLIMDFDPVRLQQVVSNLISNAIKFTPKGGVVTIATARENGEFILKVEDTGSGIAEVDLPHIFDRFYQADGSLTRQGEGSGIGLALTQELVRLFDGEITVNSVLSRGTVFELSLPIRNTAALKSDLIANTSSSKNTETVSSNPKNDALGLYLDEAKGDLKGVDVNKPLVLIADDNEDVRTYIASCLNGAYHIQMVCDGGECEKMALQLIPDLIVLDVMMPYKSGYEVCHTLKNDERTSHIPIVMLTAKADMESKLEGLAQKADHYLTKPFHKKELLLHIKNLLELREMLQQYYRSSLETGFLRKDTRVMEVASQDVALKSNMPIGGRRAEANAFESLPFANGLDNAFVNKARIAIEKHLDDTAFDVEILCQEMALSRSQMHRKLSALTGISTNYFIRYVRLLKAKELLRDSNYKISAIATDCGFNDPSYFSRVFKKEFGATPQKWRDRHKG